MTSSDSRGAGAGCRGACAGGVGWAPRPHRGGTVRRRPAARRRGSAIAKRPNAVVADEPTAQLDSETAASIMELLREVAATGTAVLMATHDRFAVEYADRVVNMEDGWLAATSTT